MSDFLRMSKIVLEWVRKKPFCKMYPVVPGKVFERTRGRVMNDASKCTLCTLCEKKCPTGAIKVDRPGGTWQINHFQCIMCNECVTNCRPGSLTMETQHAAPSVTKDIICLSVEIKKPAAKTVVKTVAKPAVKTVPKTEAKPAQAPKAEKKAAPIPKSQAPKKDGK